VASVAEHPRASSRSDCSVPEAAVAQAARSSHIVQIGALDGSGLPVSVVEQAAKLLDKSRPSNGLIERFG
jgi:hypothetical protein